MNYRAKKCHQQVYPSSGFDLRQHVIYFVYNRLRLKVLFLEGERRIELLPSRKEDMCNKDLTTFSTTRLFAPPLTCIVRSKTGEDWTSGNAFSSSFFPFPSLKDLKE